MERRAVREERIRDRRACDPERPRDVDVARVVDPERDEPDTRSSSRSRRRRRREAGARGRRSSPDSIRTRRAVQIIPAVRQHGSSPAQGRQWAVRRDRQRCIRASRIHPIRGFKSFVEPLELKLEPGVAVVVGPNGSGKSNVADAIVWAAGSLTPSELRAEKPDDVLFGGSSTRPAADHCEVELVFDNEDGGFGDEVDFSEIAITRRLVRGGEGQYLVNKAAGAPHRPRRVARRRRPRRLDALDRLPGQGRRRAGVEARGSPPPRRGGGGARQVQAPQASRGAQARPRRDPGRARPRRRGRGAQAPSASRAAGDGRRAGREARTSRSPACGHGSPQLDLVGRRRASRGCRSPTRRRRDRPPKRSGAADRAARGAPAGGGRAVGCRRWPRGGACRALPASGRERAAGAAARVGRRARGAAAQRSHGGRARRR